MPLAGLLSLGLVDLDEMSVTSADRVMMSWSTYVFNESTLVLEGVTLGEVVELVVEVLVDLSGGTVLDEETAEDTETAHPEDLAKSTMSAIVLHSSAPILKDSPTPRIAVLVISRLRTWAYERRRYPSSYRNLGGGQFVGRRSALGHGHASAW